MQAVKISQLVDGPKMSGFAKGVNLLCFAVMVTDGYDSSSMSFAAPHLAREWGLSNIDVGSIFSIQLFGVMVGSFLFGYFADRLGRRFALVSGTCLFGLLSLATSLATGLHGLYAIRFVVGLGLGGALPSAVALANEYSPQRLRVTVVAFIFAGYTIGLSGGGFVSAALIPAYGWRVVFLIGGALPLVTGVLLAFKLPESIKYLVLRRPGDPAAARIANRLRPDLILGQGTQVVADQEQHAPASSLIREIFAGPRSLMTPLLWLLYIVNSMANFALSTWMPTLMQGAGLPTGQAALAASCLAIGGAIGGLCIGKAIDRFGLAAFCVLPAFACPIIGSLGYLAGFDTALLFVAVSLGGFCVLGAQNCLHGISGSIYPTAVRANGVGWALGVAKIGSISGPFMAGLLLQRHVSIPHLFLWATVPLLAALACSLLLLRPYNVYVYRGSGPETKVQAAGIGLQLPETSR